MKHTSMQLYNSKVRKINNTVDKYIKSTILKTKTQNIQSNPTRKSKETIACDNIEQPTCPMPCPHPEKNFMTEISEFNVNVASPVQETENCIDTLTADNIEEFFQKETPKQIHISIAHAMFKLMHKAFHTSIYNGQLNWEMLSKYGRINSNEILSLLQMLPSAFEGCTEPEKIVKIKVMHLSGADVLDFINNSESAIKYVGKVVYQLASTFDKKACSTSYATATQPKKSNKAANKSVDMGRSIMSYR